MKVASRIRGTLTQLHRVYSIIPDVYRQSCCAWLLINIVSLGQHGSWLAGDKIVGGVCWSRSQEMEVDRWTSVNKDTWSLPAWCKSCSQPRSELSPCTCCPCIEQQVTTACADVVRCDQKELIWLAFAEEVHKICKGPKASQFLTTVICTSSLLFPIPIHPPCPGACGPYCTVLAHSNPPLRKTCSSICPFLKIRSRPDLRTKKPQWV